MKPWRVIFDGSIMMNMEVDKNVCKDMYGCIIDVFYYFPSSIYFILSIVNYLELGSFHNTNINFVFPDVSRDSRMFLKYF